MRNDNRKAEIIAFAVFVAPLIYMGLKIAPYMSNGLISILNRFGEIFAQPFKITLCEDSLKAVLILLLIYGITLLVYFSSKKNYRRGEEHGSAKWGKAKQVGKKYIQKPINQNKILTDNVAIGMNCKKHRRNLNTIICGAAGAGKTRFYAKPNLMQCNTSFVIPDPKGEIVKADGNLLVKKGYDVKVIDLIDMEKSYCYNPFVYLENDNDIQKLVTNLFKSTTPKGRRECADLQSLITAVYFV